ncbi:hypothetical protein NBRC110019_30910 [Neptunitalea chrysea]|uniref:Phosphatidic acid phosphatase type 2/haloperoxidase domain-containing protein n=1 Tax=Neptunitalea chrysea TaxID=1647581 RepID=A0A9W6EUX9_9FLAO|nr:phosphatase PAP2 family protein [Neptunitalea chrysea]GLB54050.1 hypothetical protein NBRC110019_30910 [Neptunitalea chrysea]
MKVVNLKKLTPFYILLSVLFVLTLIPKGNILLYLNTLHSVFWDRFFRNVTVFGDGAFIPVILLISLIFFKFKYTYQFALSASFQILIVLLLKQVLFTHINRPYFFFSEEVKATLNFVAGVKIRYTDTFPSGHTATVFVITSFLALVSKKKHRLLPYGLALIGICVAISRVYLLQHFFIDIYFGMFFGIASSVAGCYIVKKYPQKWYKKQLNIKWPPRVSAPIKKLLTTINIL